MPSPPRQTSAGENRPVTALWGVRSLKRLKDFHTIEDFRLGGTYRPGEEADYEFGGEGGVTLESLRAGPLRTAYIACGTPERDAGGRITNAIVISPFYNGDSTWFYYYWHEAGKGNDFSLGPVVGSGKLIDTNKYFVIFLDAVGLWGASKPSDGLGLRFPHYTLFDCVQANYRLLRDGLNVARVRLATGVSMGAMQSYVWAILHPGFVDAIMPIGGTTSALKDPVLRWMFGLMSAAMQSDPVWRETNGDYYHLPKSRHPNQGMMFGWSILQHTCYDLDFRIEQGWNEVRKEVFSWKPEGDTGILLKERARSFDVNDLLVRNKAQEEFDVDDYLPRIRAKTLILHVKNDLWMRAEPARRASRLIPGARFAEFESPLAHFAVFRAPNVLKKKVAEFFREAGL